MPWQTVAKQTGSSDTPDLLAVLLLSCMCARQRHQIWEFIQAINSLVQLSQALSQGQKTASSYLTTNCPGALSERCIHVQLYPLLITCEKWTNAHKRAVFIGASVPKSIQLPTKYMTNQVINMNVSQFCEMCTNAALSINCIHCTAIVNVPDVAFIGCRTINNADRQLWTNYFSLIA